MSSSDLFVHGTSMRTSAVRWSGHEGGASASLNIPTPIPRVNILGVGVHSANFVSALDAVFWAVHTSGVRGYVTLTGVHGVIESQDDRDLKIIHNRSLLSLADGVPMAWLGKARGHSAMCQVAGPDFMPAVLARSGKSGERHYLWGGGIGVASALKRELLARNPDLIIVGAETPPFRPLTQEEEIGLVDRINRTQPHFFWVGLSTPKQERFMADFLGRYAASLELGGQGFVMLGVGAAFDFQAGLTREAPRWLRGSGFEWFYRLLSDPRRLWKRYLRNNPRFVVGLLRQAMQPTHFPMIGYDRSSPFDQ
jgi:N-acetylglucosaminyldiphosphoundecaprenol N-acetyl-beta-D-mannosaminyltransferase